MPKLISTFALAGMVALSLSACAPQSNPDCAVAASGGNSARISVSGPAGAEPTVSMPSPIETERTERTVITAGDGDVVKPGMLVTLNYVLYNASTGQKASGSGDYTKGSEISFIVDDVHAPEGLAKAVQCSTVGSRVAAIIPPAEGFGADGAQLGLGESDSMVFVFDVTGVAQAPSAPPQEPAADLPVPEGWSADVPAVSFAADVPVVTLPDTGIPAELLLAVLEDGDGAVVNPASTVSVDYQGISWDTGEIFDQSYVQGGPRSFPVAGVVPGFAAAMVGQKVGSTLLVSIPPQFAYGTNPAAHKLGNQTLLFLIQIRDAS